MAKKNQPLKKGFISANRIQLLIITILVFLVYFRTIQFDFVDVDDTTLIVNNYKYLHKLGNLTSLFSHDVFYNPQVPGSENAYYRPIVALSIMLDSQVGGQSPKFYHFMNILFHLFCCFLLFRLLLLMKYRSEMALCGTILLAVHPALSQAIGWIPGRNDSLLTLFVLASLIYFIRFLTTGNKRYWWVHILFFALALFTKETAVFLPFIAWLYYFLIHKKEKNGIKNTLRFKEAGALALGYLLFFVLWFLLRKHALANAPVDLSITNLGKTLIENLPIWLQVVQKLVAPYNLSIISIVKDTNFIISIILIVILILFLVLSNMRRNQYILFGFIWFNFFLLPAFMVPVLTGFEHRAYLPFIGFLLIIFEIDYFKNLNYSKPVSFVFITVLTLIYIGINFNHVSAFANHFNFWEKAATNSPNSSLAKLNYGYALWEEGKEDEAIKIYNEGLAINPNQPMIHNDLGIIYGQEKKFDEAEKEFKEENRVNPDYSTAYYNLGLVYEMTQKEDEMVAAWKEALAKDSNNINARNALEGYFQKKRVMQ